jgi:hypothetical protein
MWVVADWRLRSWGRLSLGRKKGGLAEDSLLAVERACRARIAHFAVHNDYSDLLHRLGSPLGLYEVERLASSGQGEGGRRKGDGHFFFAARQV